MTKKTRKTHFKSGRLAREKTRKDTVIAALPRRARAGTAAKRRNTREKLRESMNRLKVLTQNLNSGVALIDKHGKFSIVNPAFLQMFGLSEDSDIKNVNDLNWGEWQVFDENGTLLSIDEHPVRKAAISGNRVKNQLVGVRAPSVTDLKWMLISAEPILKPSGRMEAVICTCYDITKRRQAEAALRESEARYRSLFEHMLEGFAYCEMLYDERGQPEDFVYLAVNEAFGRLTGLADVIGKRVTQVIPRTKELNPELFEIYGRVARTGEPARFEIDFKPLSLYLSVSVYSPAKGYFVATFDDISQRKLAEEALRQSESLYRAIGESIDYGIWVCDAQGRNTYASESFLKLVGITQEQCSGLGWGDVLHPDDVEATIAAWKQCVQSGGPWYREHRYRGVDGQWHPILACGVAVRNEQNEVTAWAGINLDISQLKQTEEALRQAVKELSRSNRDLEQFAYVASHDLQEPMRQVIAFVNLLRDRYRSAFDTKGEQYMAYVVEGASRMSALVSGLLAYSRIEDKGAAVQSVSAKEAFEEALTNLRSTIEEAQAQVTCDELPTILADRVQLSQLFQNLIGNAIKFRREGVQSEIHVGCQADGQTCTFCVRDNGIGIPRELHDKAFQVFQRLHGQGKYPGTGIGLAICKKIVEHHGGRIWIESTVGEGSTFFFTLPLAKEANA